MRVISGYLKGRKLYFIKEKGIRLTKDIVREAIFDTLRGWIVGKRVIEIFAGIGALGIESISHGAKEVIFVEKDKRVVELIKKNLKELGISDKGVVKSGRVEDFIEEFKDLKYDIIIADPPYDYPEGKIKKLLEKIVELNVINEEGIVVFEHSIKKKLPEVEGLEVYKTRKYGKSCVSYLRRKK